ncbi:CAR family subclass B3 metallo-beta-lactamase [Hyphomonas sp.]|uniref:CAR family subclass B3 metallo-beta-lactamase n=1 Tax=Hyphomonas sp. TaxID=87 RepID=UPI003451CEC2
MNLLKKTLTFLGTASLVVGCAAQARTPAPVVSAPHAATTAPLTGCPSATVNALFEDFGNTGKMPPELAAWLSDPKSQITEPYQAFDNVYNVGICWVSAWLIKTSEGLILVDTLYEPYTDQLIQNIKLLGLDPADIKMALVTHGHFDHAGGISTIKSLTNAKIVMTKTGWSEARANAQSSQEQPTAWTMPTAADLLVKDGDVLTLGDTKVYVYETPGHTAGTVSYGLDVKDGPQAYRAIVIGGLGLNAIEDSRQVEAYISSVDRIKALVSASENPVLVNLATHPFSSGLTEIKERLKTRKPGQPHPLVDPEALLKQLDVLRAGATKRLAVEQALAKTKTP